MLINCHECGAQVSTDARACMRCGAPPRLQPESKEASPNREKINSKISEEHAEKKAKLVSFEKAVYNIVCPICEGPLLVKAKLLSRLHFLTCSHRHVHPTDENFSVDAIKTISLSEGKVCYRRLTDFFSYSGRLSASDYWWSCLICLPLLIINRMIPGPVFPILLFGLLHSILIKRYQDLGMRGEWVAIQGATAVILTITNLLLPNTLNAGETYPTIGVLGLIGLIASLVSGIMLAFVPGDKKCNRYGPPKSEVKRIWW